MCQRSVMLLLRDWGFDIQPSLRPEAFPLSRSISKTCSSNSRSMIPCVTVGPACTRHRQTGRVTNYDKLGNHRRRSLLPIVPRTYTSTICSKVYSFLALSKTSDIILHDHHALIHPRYRHIGWLSCQSTPRGLKQLFHCHYTHCCAYHDVHFLLYFHCH